MRNVARAFEDDHIGSFAGYFPSQFFNAFGAFDWTQQELADAARIGVAVERRGWMEKRKPVAFG